MFEKIALTALIAGTSAMRLGSQSETKTTQTTETQTTREYLLGLWWDTNMSGTIPVEEMNYDWLSNAGTYDAACAYSGDELPDATSSSVAAGNQCAGRKYGAGCDET